MAFIGTLATAADPVVILKLVRAPKVRDRLGCSTKKMMARLGLSIPEIPVTRTYRPRVRPTPPAVSRADQPLGQAADQAGHPAPPSQPGATGQPSTAAGAEVGGEPRGSQAPAPLQEVRGAPPDAHITL